MENLSVFGLLHLSLMHTHANTFQMIYSGYVLSLTSALRKKRFLPFVYCTDRDFMWVQGLMEGKQK